MQGPDFLIPLTIFAGGAIVAYKYFDGRHKERMTAIEKGLNPADLKSIAAPKMWRAHPLTNLKWGLILLFVGVAILTANVIHEMTHLEETALYWSSILIAGGLALVLFYTIANSKLKKEESES
jgi:hypothetical protein